MAIPIYQVDAFAGSPFRGNPAAVCVLHDEKSSDWMQSVAAEMNLSETAFVRRRSGDPGFDLRWFTPAVEVALCGHATLASAHALWSEGHVPAGETIRFHTQSGVLTCGQRDALIELDFPAMPATECDPPPGLLDAVGVRPSFVGRSRFDTFLLVESEASVRSIVPDFRALREITGLRGVIATSASSDARFDFISRYFAPGAGVDEDPVTGSAHCTLAPFWGARLGRTAMTGFQASRRGGVVHVRLADDRVVLGGRAVTVLRGELLV
ncbi:MAG: PhzF family phenazine biosynthesis protein [Phycisphaeraceae bacterium]|nr:PhzF family phenazine biosynthesis protein [Phycisphaeraceae bacterium]